jgi:hypothetical protein
MSPQRWRIIVLACIWIVAATASACKVPVFRYALERWSVDRYRMVAIVEDQASQSIGLALAELKTMAGSSANVEVEIIDLSKMSELDLWQLDQFDPSIETPRLQLFYPERNGIRKKCWEGELTRDAVRFWFDSPQRRQIADDLVSGASAVWLMVDGADEQQNLRLAEHLSAALAEAASEIEIPEGVIPREGANRYLQEHPEASMDDVLRSDVPLKVEFRVRRLSRDDVDETGLLAMVDGLAETAGQPLLVPIFGRGRMLDALPAAGTDRATIINACRYMVGECSCTVKTLNPGVDLILNVDWQQQLGESVVIIDHSFAADSESTPQLVDVPTGRAVLADDPPKDDPPTDGAENSHSRIGLVLVSLFVAIGYIVHRLR